MPQKPVLKTRKLYSNRENNQEITQEKIVKWIEDVENSPPMSLEELNVKWERKEKETLNHIHQ